MSRSPTSIPMMETANPKPLTLFANPETHDQVNELGSHEQLLGL
eukprot:CAMPEP_0184296108 /NCGR_PEP_ID=MMETSP1049-20130417/7076_1 /TAXON_ID=77928 /ORGANISM="Proteomonas sulcata, Strain CCMP704" /LENGTH=43 /DNA_ID= /DNA_START= /DNA_END= /DNA_ORIENTATION=